jgi:hypothetical protein
MMQVCIRCNINLPIDDFEHQKNRPNPRKICKKCRYTERDREKEKARHREYMRERRQNDPDAIRRNWERSTYGVCKEDLGILECQICGSTNRLCIDHDHQSEAVRGILCTKCNFGISYFNDNVTLLANAIKYLSLGG